MSNSNKKVLLTGGEGFIGRNFYKLYKDKYEIVDDRTDVREIEIDMFGGYDMVVHLAAYAGVRRSHEIPEEFWDNNVNGTRNIFREAQGARVPVIYASSSSIYEWWLSPYATTKKVCEEVAHVNTLGLRFHTVYGEDSRPDMLYDMLRNRKVSYLTDHVRDWTHVEDICSAIDICIEKFDLIDLPAIDVGNGKPVTVVDMAEKVWPGNNLPLREVTGERTSTCADPSVLAQLGWVPKHHILED